MTSAKVNDILDNLDIKILSRLLDNCRESDRQIGRAIGISGGAVGARISKMQESGVIERFSVKVEPPVLGHGVLYVVVSGQDMGRILEQSRLVGDPFFVVPCVGGITVCSIVVRGSMEKKIELAKKLMSDVRMLSIFEAEDPGFDTNLTRTDLEVLECLIGNPRQKIEDLAREAGLSTKTVARCVEKLQGSEGVSFTLVYDPTRIDGFIPHVILAWIEGDLKGTLANMKGELSESFLQIPFIAKNQIVLFMYSRDIFEMDDLTQKVRSMDGVSSADLFIPKKISFPDDWLKEAIGNAKKSPKLHLALHAG